MVRHLFTEYFYHPWLGTLILCLWWLLLMWLVKRAFRIADRWSVLTLIPVALIMVTIVDMGYWIYLLKLPGHVFVTTIGTTIVAALLWGFRCLPSKYGIRTAYIVATAVIGYPLLGIYALGGTLVMGIWQWSLEKERTMKIVNSAIALLAIWIVPVLFYRNVFCQINQTNIYSAGLPLYIAQVELKSNGRWVIFSSRRDDGVFTRPFMAHIDANGQESKPFELPCADPDYHRQLLRSYNIPEFMLGPVDIKPQTFADVLNGDGEPPVKYVKQLSR